MRIGDSLRVMSDTEVFRILSEREPDFSAKICEGLIFEDLDAEAIMPKSRKILHLKPCLICRFWMIWDCEQMDTSITQP
jgi:hypothetical protein